MQRAKPTSKVNEQNYYSEIHKILEKYNLFDKTERIYNVDEKGNAVTISLHMLSQLQDIHHQLLPKGTNTWSQS